MLVKPTTFLPVAWLLLFLSVGRVDAQYRPYRLASIDQRSGADAVRLPSAVDGLNSQNSSVSGRAQTVSSQLGVDGAPVVPPDIQSLSPSGQANEFIPPGPVADDQLMQWGVGSDEFLSPYMMRPTALNGFFFQWDQMLWSLANTPQITVVGDTLSEGWASVGGTVFWLSNDMNTDINNGQVHSGQRFEFGHEEGGSGWFSSVSFGSGNNKSVGSGVNFVPSDPDNLMQGFEDANGDGFDDDTDGDGVYGRFGIDTDGDFEPDTGAPIDLDDTVYWLITFDELVIRDYFQFSGAELNRSFRRSSRWELFYGVRYADFREYFSLTGSGSLVSPFELTTVAKNQIIGPQFGARFNAALYKFILNIEGRFMPGYNHQRSSQSGRVGPPDIDGSGAPGGPAGFLPTTIRQNGNNDEFSAVGELRADAILPINRFMAFRFGYTGFVMSGISYASPKVVYELPRFGITDVSSDETILVNAFTVGLEINR